MASTKVPITISYKKLATQPPVYVAGSYSQPSWQPEEMDVVTDAQGNHTFKKEILAEPGSNVQYKFRLGPGDWWVLDEATETATDDNGNRNNVLQAPDRVAIPDLPIQDTEKKLDSAENTDSQQQNDSQIQSPGLSESELSKDLQGSQIAAVASEVADSAAIADAERPEPTVSAVEAGQTGIRRLSTTPISEVAQNAAEVADSAENLDNNEDHDSTLYAGQSQSDSGRQTPMEEPCPLFSHECIGDHDYDNNEDSGVDDTNDIKEEPKSSIPPENGLDQYDLDGVDLDDPRFEKFPSDRESILTAMRRLETSTTEDQTRIDGKSLSPVITSHTTQSREELPHEVAVGSPLLDAHSPTENHRLGVPRTNLGSMASERSQSLHSITEELGESEEPDTARVVLPSPQWSSKSAQTLHSDDDEGVVMKNTRQQKPPASDDLKTGGSSKADAGVSPRSELPKTPEPAIDAAASTEEATGLNISTKDSSAETAGESQETESPRNVTHQPKSDDNPPASGDDPKSPDDTAKSTSVDTGVQSQITRRGAQNERPTSPTSVRSAGKEVEKEGFFRAFVRVLFVDWIGGFISRLCGSRRKALLATSTTVLLAGFAWKVAKDSGFTPSMTE